jgi:4a-hydroxytetrahydrobiopterin dehydratase
MQTFATIWLLVLPIVCSSGFKLSAWIIKPDRLKAELKTISDDFWRIQMKLNEEQIQNSLSRLADWRLEGDWLTRDLKFENFKGAMEFVNRVADEAEAMDHHPDILIHGWNNVRLSVMTHSVGGLTEKDFRLAERINGLV